MKNQKNVAYSMSALMLAVVGYTWMTSDEPELPMDSPQRAASISNIESTAQFTSPMATEPFHFRPAVNSDEVWISEGVKAQMADVADTYKENMRYPEYSKPLHESDWSMLNPRAFIPKQMELDLNGLAAEIVIDEYIVDRDRDLAVKVNIHGMDSQDTGVSEVGIFLSSGKQVVEADISRTYTVSKGVLTYHANVPASQFEIFQDSELALGALILLESGDQAQVSAAIKLAETEAVLTHLGTSYVDGSDLSIPAYFEVSSSGYYRVRANVFDLESEQAISHINAAFMLSDSENEGVLKIHASTLRSKGFAGPYLIKDFDITRGPARPGDKTGYGSSEKEEFSVQGFDLNSYSHEPYHDPKNQQRLEFLQKMAGIE